MVTQLVKLAEHTLAPNGKFILIIGETVVRKRMQSAPICRVCRGIALNGNFVLVDAIKDSIPDVRRSRRDCEGTKAEHILVYERRLG